MSIFFLLTQIDIDSPLQGDYANPAGDYHGGIPTGGDYGMPTGGDYGMPTGGDYAGIIYR